MTGEQTTLGCWIVHLESLKLDLTPSPLPPPPHTHTPWSLFCASWHVSDIPTVPASHSFTLGEPLSLHKDLIAAKSWCLVVGFNSFFFFLFFCIYYTFEIVILESTSSPKLFFETSFLALSAERPGVFHEIQTKTSLWDAILPPSELAVCHL